MKTTTSKPTPKFEITATERSEIERVFQELTSYYAALAAKEKSTEQKESKIERLADDVQKIREKLDPMNDDQCAKLSAKETQLRLLRESLDTGEDDSSLWQDCRSSLHEVRTVLGRPMGRELEKRIKHGMEVIRPLYDESNWTRQEPWARQLVMQTPHVSGYQSALTFPWLDPVMLKVSTCPKALAMLQAALDGNDPTLIK